MEQTKMMEQDNVLSEKQALLVDLRTILSTANLFDQMDKNKRLPIDWKSRFIMELAEHNCRPASMKLLQVWSYNKGLIGSSKPDQNGIRTPKFYPLEDARFFAPWMIRMAAEEYIKEIVGFGGVTL